MSKTAVNQVIQRAVSDAAFRRQLQREPGKALAGIDLSADERSAITSGDPTRLTALGVDQRMSKAFGLGALGDVSKTVAGDATGSGGHAAFADEATSSAMRGLVSPNPGADGDAALIGTGGAGGGAMFDAGGAASGGTAGIIGDPSSATSAAFDVPGDGSSIDAGVVGTGDGASASAFDSTGGVDGNSSLDAQISANEYGGVAGDPTSVDKAFSAEDGLDTSGDGNVVSQ